MKPQKITRETWPQAVELLCEGFPERNAQFWSRGLERWSDIVGDPFETPIGFLSKDKNGNASSVLLTFCAPKTWNENQHVNFSSWYVREKYRATAPLMLKRLSSDSSKTYTDFTPNEPVQQMLGKLGYHEFTANHLGYFTPLYALKSAPAILKLNALMEHFSSDKKFARALSDHHECGCIILGVNTPAGPSPLVLRVKTRKRFIRCAEIIYCGDISHLRSNLPGISRALLQRGVLILEGAFPQSADLPAPNYSWGETSRFVKGDWSANQIDCLYSEIPILGV